MTDKILMDDEDDESWRSKIDPTTQKILELAPKPISGEEQKLYFKAIFYGDFGTRKTVTSCRFGKTLILAQDPGWKSYTNHPELIGMVDPVPFVGYRQLEAIVEGLKFGHPDYRGYETFVLDTISGIQEAYVDAIVRGLTVNKDTRPKYSELDPKYAADVPVRELPGRDDYHMAKNVLRPTIQKLNTLPINVIYIAHEREPGEDEKKRTNALKYKRPSITEALFKVIARDVDLIGHFEADDEKYTVSFRRVKETVAKSRIREIHGKIIPTEYVHTCIQRWQNREPIFPEKK